MRGVNMDYLVEERLELIETIRNQVLNINEEDIPTINTILLNQIININNEDKVNSTSTYRNAYY